MGLSGDHSHRLTSLILVGDAGYCLTKMNQQVSNKWIMGNKVHFECPINHWFAEKQIPSGITEYDWQIHTWLLSRWRSYWPSSSGCLGQNQVVVWVLMQFQMLNVCSSKNCHWCWSWLDAHTAYRVPQDYSGSRFLEERHTETFYMCFIQPGVSQRKE